MGPPLLSLPPARIIEGIKNVTVGYSLVFAFEGDPGSNSYLQHIQGKDFLPKVSQHLRTSLFYSSALPNGTLDPDEAAGFCF